MSRLPEEYLDLIFTSWPTVFAQTRTLYRAVEHSMTVTSVMGRRTISRSICALDRADQDWSADYKFFSRSRWDEQELFSAVYQQRISLFADDPVVSAAIDDTKLSKTGKKIPGTQYYRDPLSPPFHVNFLYGQRFIQAALIFPLYRQGDFDPRAIPVRFVESVPLKKPGKRATELEREHYKKVKKIKNLSTDTVTVITKLRMDLDRHGGAAKTLLCALDGSFCNQTIFRAPLDRTVLLARCRKDARLCLPAAPGTRRKYDPRVFTPEEVRKDQAIPWKEALVWYGGTRRSIRYKDVPSVLWRRGSGRRKLRLIVLAPQPYKRSPHSPTYYRDPAYLLVTDTDLDSPRVIQAALDRWQIEVNHREEKTTLGVGQAQVWSSLAVPRHPTFMVSCYSLLHLAALRAFGPGRPDAAYLPLPKWRKNARRASLLDIITVLRREINETQISTFVNENVAKNLIPYADA